LFISSVTMRIFNFLFILFFIWSFSALSQSGPCDLKREKEGIKVYTCKSDTSKFRTLTAEFILAETSFEELEAFMWNVGNYIHWQYNMVEAIMVKRLNDHEMIYRSLIDAPWPLEDRELLVKFSLNRIVPNQLSFTINSITYDYPLKDGVIRVPFSQASWQVTRQGTSLLVKYTLNIDPGGYVPPLLVNLAMAEGPFESFRNLKKLIENQ